MANASMYKFHEMEHDEVVTFKVAKGSKAYKNIQQAASSFGIRNGCYINTHYNDDEGEIVCSAILEYEDVD